VKERDGPSQTETERVASGTKCGVCIPGWRETLSHWLLYLVLSKNTEETAEMIETTLKLPRKQLEAFENESNLVRSFQTNKLITWPLPFEAELKAQKILADPTHGPKRMEILRRRVIQHNLKVVSLYYSRIRTDRLMQLLNLSQKEVESELSTLVVDGTLCARIDRPERIIVFGVAKTPEEEMGVWSERIDRALDLVQVAGHLISKEKMIQEARAKALKAK